MKYIRTFRLQVAHFNSMKAYELARRLIDTQKLGYEDVLFCLHSIHGHNLKIVVALERELHVVDWIVDDVKLTKAIMEWDNRNLSLHTDFFGQEYRATTERMAQVLFFKLQHVPEIGDAVKRVEVWENEDICAVSEGTGY